jgi:sialidase-1
LDYQLKSFAVKNIFSYLIVSLSCLSLKAQNIDTTKTLVFAAGTEGHKSYRIPAIIQLPNNELLAFCEGRVNGAGDFGDINIVMKRSTDKGVTWSSLQTVVDAASLQAGNPAPVVDVTDPKYPNGRVFLFYNTGNNQEAEVRKGNGLREVWYVSSFDCGLSWSKPVNITTQVHRPMQPTLNADYIFTADWRSYANTPGHALQIKEGKYRGRMYVAANHSVGNPNAQAKDYFAHGFYTDDHGKTFHVSETINLPGGNESTAAEISNGGLLLNARNQPGDVKARIVARSKDGGKSWSSIGFDKNLPDPVCEGSLLNIGKHNGKQVLAFCNAADTLQRNNLTLRISFDEGQTWERKILIDRTNDKQNDYTAYSDLVLIDENNIGVLYEKDNYKTIVFSVIQFK